MVATLRGKNKYLYIFDKMRILITILLKILLLIVPLLIAVAFVTVAERKVMGAMQRRKGPNVVGFYGMLQAFADGLKLFIKEIVLPSNANLGIFFIAPILTLLLSFIGWAVIPFKEDMIFADLNIAVLYSFAISSLGVYGIICSGWASNSKYAFLGALRSAAQMISYEVSFGLILLTLLLVSGSLNLVMIVVVQQYIWFIVPFFPLFIMFFISALAETNRPPFDLPEAEAELVSGYSTEYSAMGFAFFFIGEYANIILMSTLCAIFFLGGWWPIINLIFVPEPMWLAMKVCFVIFLFVWVRVALPRFRYDQLMRLGWKTLLPLSLATFVFVASVMQVADILP